MAFYLFIYLFSSTSLLLPTHLPPPSCTHARSCNPMDFSPPDSSVHGFFQARILEWVAISFSTSGILKPQVSFLSLWARRQLLTKWPVLSFSQMPSCFGMPAFKGRIIPSRVAAKWPNSKRSSFLVPFLREDRAGFQPGSRSQGYSHPQGEPWSQLPGGWENLPTPGKEQSPEKVSSGSSVPLAEV